MTEDGFERTFQVNHLSHFLLVKLLLEKGLLTSACSSSSSSSSSTRVIVVSSESHRHSFLSSQNISQEYLSPLTPSRFTPIMAYNDSKLCNVLFATQLNERLSRQKVFASSLHPGNMISTGISRNWWFYRLLFAAVRPFTKSCVSWVECSLISVLSTSSSSFLLCPCLISIFFFLSFHTETTGTGSFNHCLRCYISWPGKHGWTILQQLLPMSCFQECSGRGSCKGTLEIEWRDDIKGCHSNPMMTSL